MQSNHAQLLHSDDTVGLIVSGLSIGSTAVDDAVGSAPVDAVGWVECRMVCRNRVGWMAVE